MGICYENSYVRSGFSLIPYTYGFVAQSVHIEMMKKKCSGGLMGRIAIVSTITSPFCIRAIGAEAEKVLKHPDYVKLINNPRIIPRKNDGKTVQSFK